MNKIQQGNQIQITKRGKITAQVVPEVDKMEAARQRLEALQDKGYMGDVISPIDDLDWSADEDHL